MMNTRKLILSILIGLLAVSGKLSAQPARPLPSDLSARIDSLKRVYVPDSRVALFEMEFTLSGRQMMVSGVTTSVDAKEALLQMLADEQYRLVDCVQVVPDAHELKGKTCGILNVSVANLRVKPDFSAEMTTQGLLGMPVRLLQQNGWYRIQTPDRYIAWVHPVGVYPVSPEEFEKWQTAPKLVVTSHYGFVFSKPDETSVPVSDVVAGNRLKLVKSKGAYYLVEYPDGRRGYLSKKLAMPEIQWLAEVKQDAASILHTAHTLMGVPYLWAGTSSKGVDCSGFVQLVFQLHHIQLPRDASQQAYVGRHIEIATDLSNLLPGDLLFFGRKAADGQKERISHVGLYVGEGRFIHSQGNVHISSLEPEDSLFDAFNLARLLFATRIISDR